MSTNARLPIWLRLLHVLFLVLLTTEVAYASYMVFFVMQPPGTAGPLLFNPGAVESIDAEFLMVRRMYALEAWLAFGALALYVGLTEILPRRRPV